MPFRSVDRLHLKDGYVWRGLNAVWLEGKRMDKVISRNSVGLQLIGHEVSF